VPRRVLVFGGSGLLGTHLATALVAGGAVVWTASRRAATVPGSDWIPCDVAVAADVERAFRAARPDAVVHLAAALQGECERDPALAIRVNIGGTHAILRQAGEQGTARVILASSLAAYGESAGELTETSPAGDSISLYGSAKRFEEALGERYANRCGYGFAALRYSGLIGSGGSSGGAGMAMIRRALEATRHGGDVLIDTASGDEKAQLTHVDDAVAATLALLDRPAWRHHVYNVAGPRENYLSLREYHAAICRLRPGSGKATFTGRARSAGWLSMERLRQETGFVPRITVREGLARMFAEDGPDATAN
jgi:nucleoside-diphosphate-sugar epimerase